MIRIAGILTGASLAIGCLIVLLGVPDFSPPAVQTELTAQLPPGIPTDGPLTDTVLLPAEPAVADEQAADLTSTDSAPEDPPPAAPPAVEQPAAEVPVPEQPAAGAPGDEAYVQQQLPAATDAALAGSTVQPLPAPSDAHWYAFWSPFRSEIAADGFVTELQRRTGLDYRVVKLKAGVYEVAFAYSDEHDIEDKLAQISTATGLDLSGG